MTRFTPCQDEDPDLFFPVSTTGPALAQIAAAVAVCRQCPVISECLAGATRRGELFGVWGGQLFPRATAYRAGGAPKRVTTARTTAAGFDLADVAFFTEIGMSTADIADTLGVRPDSVTRAVSRHTARHAAAA